MSASGRDRGAALRALVERAEAVLARAVTAHLAAAADDGGDVLRTLRVRSSEALLALLEQPSLHVPDAAGSLAQGDPLELIERFGIDRVDHALVVLALLPELDARFQAVFGFLHDDASRVRPSLGLALRIVAGERAWSDGSLARLGERRPLRWLGLLGANDPAPLASAPLAPAAGVVERLVAPEDAPGCGELVAAGRSGLARAELGRLQRAFGRGGRREPRRLNIAAPSAELCRRAAADVAARTGRELLARSPGADPAGDAALRCEALLRGAVLYSEQGPELIAGHPGPAILGPTAASRPEGPLVVLGEPGRAGRIRRWRQELGAARLATVAADRVTLRGDAIERAGRSARALAAADARPVDFADIACAVRAEARTALVDLATQVDLRVGWDDLVLPEATVAQLRELCSWVVHRAGVRDAWGYDKQRIASGVTALFAGASGTGKSMAAEVVAGDLGLPLWRVDLARVVSKYVGETEKNLDRVFASAESSGAMLVFDEADALFGRRGEIRHGNDRYANLEVSYLLQRMEAYGGLAVLTTNLRGNLDDAFIRRLAFTISFPFPDAEERERHWERAWPAATPCSDDIDRHELADRFALSGANIANAGLAAAYAAAADGKVVREEHVLAAIEGELGKLGAHAAVEAP